MKASSRVRLLRNSLLLIGMLSPSIGGWTDTLDWFVYKNANSPENHGVWSNVMPPGAESKVHIAPATIETPSPGSNALKLTFDVAGQDWAGIVVTPKAGYWGETPGPGFDLRDAVALELAARGARGGEGVRFKAGIAPDQPYGDTASLPIDTGWVALTETWQTIRIPIGDRDFSRIVTPFVVMVNGRHNPDGPPTIYLDDIRYVGAR